MQTFSVRESQKRAISDKVSDGDFEPFPSLEVPIGLFPELRTLPTYRACRDYVQAELVRMANEGTLSVTTLKNQTGRAQTLVAEILYGHAIDDGTFSGSKHTQVTGIDVPEELQNYQVTIESIDGGPIEYVDGKVQVSSAIAGYGRARSESPIPEFVDRVKKLNGPRATVSLLTAWKILSQFGAYCVVAKHARDQHARWLYREVPRAELEDNQQSTRAKKRDRE